MPRDISNHPDALRIARQPDANGQYYLPWGGPIRRPSQDDIDRAWAERTGTSTAGSAGNE